LVIYLILRKLNLKHLVAYINLVMEFLGVTWGGRNSLFTFFFAQIAVVMGIGACPVHCSSFVSE
jgi:hypothetical protein